MQWKEIVTCIDKLTSLVSDMKMTMDRKTLSV